MAKIEDQRKEISITDKMGRVRKRSFSSIGVPELMNVCNFGFFSVD